MKMNADPPPPGLMSLLLSSLFLKVQAKRDLGSLTMAFSAMAPVQQAGSKLVWSAS